MSFTDVQYELNKTARTHHSQDKVVICHDKLLQNKFIRAEEARVSRWEGESEGGKSTGERKKLDKSPACLN